MSTEVIDSIRRMADVYARVDRHNMDGCVDRYIAHLRGRRDFPSIPPLTSGMVLLNERGEEISPEYDFIDPSVSRDGTFTAQLNIDEEETYKTFCMKYTLDRDGNVVSKKKNRIWKGCSPKIGESAEEYAERYMKERDEAERNE